MSTAQSKPLAALIAALMLSGMWSCSSLSKAQPSPAETAAVQAATDSLVSSGSGTVVPVIDDVAGGRLLCVVPLHSGLTVRRLVDDAPPVKALCGGRIILVCRKVNGAWTHTPAGPETPDYDMELVPFDKVLMAAIWTPPPTIQDAKVGKIYSPADRLFGFLHWH
jgi:hypothetical protein